MGRKRVQFLIHDLSHGVVSAPLNGIHEAKNYLRAKGCKVDNNQPFRRVASVLDEEFEGVVFRNPSGCAFEIDELPEQEEKHAEE